VPAKKDSHVARKVAIACQGGGTHAAFTWGVLRTILETKKLWDASPDGGDTFDIVALSGTSAGAMCALATWYGLVPNTADPGCGSIDKARERLDSLWTTFAATTPVEHFHNRLAGTLLTWKEKGLPLPQSNPYDALHDLALTGLATMGARPEYLGFPALLEDLCPDFASIDWPRLRNGHPRILVGAIEILSGNFELFDSEKTLQDLDLAATGEEAEQYRSTRWRMRRPISLAGVAASGTLPEILPAQAIEETRFPTCDPAATVTRTGHYWDGLYSQNPPVRNLLDSDAKDDKPDEIWVVRINPQEFPPPTSSIGLDDIRDRENDLAGNLSLNQELDHILTMNRWIERYGNDHPPLDNRKVVTVRTIKMSRTTVWGLGHASKLDRSPGHLARLREEGEEIAQRWLADWRALGADFASYPNDARYSEQA
jgi:NTE family protein